ncbi:MAG: hypothetical protein Q4A67_04550 [Aerococcus sp.]|nr:hypothetical protein [Aerococcus sp.]
MWVNWLFGLVITANLLLLGSGYYLYRKSAQSRYLIAIFLGLLLLVLLGVLLALHVLL